LIVELAESFGMMIVKLETREFRLQQSIEELEGVNRELQLARQTLASENRHLKHHLRQKFSAKNILGKSRQIQEILTKIEKIADTPVNVLITGETGTGKELVAKAIHYNSSRADRFFVALNCSALPETLLESELFGIEKGVATGVERRIGRIEQADGGTLFLDEIGDMPLTSQAKILRVLEEREVERIGWRKAVPVDVRIVAATNKMLKGEIRKGSFREDLFYRLNVVHIHIPPLRERTEDIPVLLTALLESCSRRLGRGPMRFTPEAVECLKQHSWPGNVRELENEVERGIALTCSDTISVDDLSEEVRDHIRQKQTDVAAFHVSTYNLKEIELEVIRRAMSEVQGNKSEAARKLGLSREGLRKILARHGDPTISSL
jgi:transcriptional regulator with PAS, ATPase and Fis domain